MNKRIEINRHTSAKRRLFAVDIENIVGCGKVTEEESRKVAHTVEQRYMLGSNDHVVVGVSHGKNAFAAKAWYGARLVFQRGKNGAYLALKHVLETEKIEERYDEVYVFSGDGIFAESVSMLKSKGVFVEVISEASRVSKKLMHSAQVINLFSDKAPDMPAVTSLPLAA